MTLEELEKTLPNGLHDSKIIRIEIDYKQRKLTLDLEIWIGNLGTAAPEHREEYKRAQILISGLLVAAMEPPDPRYPFSTAAGLTVDGCDMSKNLSIELMSALPSDAFFRSLWVYEWNAFIHISGASAELTWADHSSAQSQEPTARLVEANNETFSTMGARIR